MSPPTSHKGTHISSIQYRKPVRGSLIWWLRFLGVVAFFIIVLRLPKAQAVELVRIDLRWLGFCMLLTIMYLLLEAFVWHLLLSIQHIRHPYPKTLVAYLAGQYLGMVTPGHVGDYLTAGYISMNTGITFGYALSSVVMKKLLSWVAVVACGLWALPLLAQVPLVQGVERMLWISLGVLVVLSAAITMWVVSLRRLARKWRRLSPWQVDITEFWAGMRSFVSTKLMIPCAMAIVAFSLVFFQLDAVLHALGIALPFVLVAKIMAFSRIAAKVVPLSVVGFGSKDAAVITLLAQYHVDPSIGLTATLLLLVCSYLLTLLLSGLCWWIKPLVIQRRVMRDRLP